MPTLLGSSSQSCTVLARHTFRVSYRWLGVIAGVMPLAPSVGSAAVSRITKETEAKIADRYEKHSRATRLHSSP